jgi:hypothetical protein
MIRLPKPQKLCQRTERGCAVPVFATLAAIPDEQVLNELPHASEGMVTFDRWLGWLEEKGYEVLRRDGCNTDILPCAHLVANSPQSEKDFHWVYRDEDGDVHDPSPVSLAMPADHPWMRGLSGYNTKVCTISVTRRPL